MLRNEGGRLVGSIHDLFNFLEASMPRPTSGIDALVAAEQSDMIFIFERCNHCGIPKNNRTAMFCDVCQAIHDSLNTAYWAYLHNEWEKENALRIAVKRRIMGQAEEGGR